MSPLDYIEMGRPDGRCTDCGAPEYRHLLDNQGRCSSCAEAQCDFCNHWVPKDILWAQKDGTLICPVCDEKKGAAEAEPTGRLTCR